ncbi:hypothetical protein AG4045_018553, partial [Apium graveolens]
YYKEDTHPNQLKRNEIAQALGMEPNQIRYWFQNKRSQVKNQSTREKNETFQSENDNLRAQIQYFTEVLSNKNCQECGWAEENILRSENIRLREEFFFLKVTSSTEGKRRILKVAERMANNFFFGITGPKGGRWTKLNWNFGDDVRLMSTRVMDDPGIRNSTLLSVSTSFVLSNSPKMVFDFLRDHSFRKK